MSPFLNLHSPSRYKMSRNVPPKTDCLFNGPSDVAALHCNNRSHSSSLNSVSGEGLDKGFSSEMVAVNPQVAAVVRDYSVEPRLVTCGSQP